MTPEAAVERIIERGREELATNHERYMAWLMLNSDYARNHMLDLFRKKAG